MPRHQKDFNELLGKTIKKVYRNHNKEYDDEDIIVVEFTDGTSAYVLASYGAYTGNSLDEYPRYVSFGIMHGGSK